MSSSSSTSISPMLADWSIDKRPAETAISHAIGLTNEKRNGLSFPLVSFVLDYLKVEKERCGGIFGEKEWSDHFGSVPVAPRLPSNIEEIWQSPCPIYPQKKMSETHTFLYIPSSLNGFPLNLKNFGEQVARDFPKINSLNAYHLPGRGKQMEDNPVGYSYWILMTNEPLPESKDKSFSDQQALVEDLAKNTLTVYTVPTALEATLCIAAEFMNSKKCLFSDTNLRCKENFQIGIPKQELGKAKCIFINYQISVSGCSTNGVIISSSQSRFAGGNTSIAGIRKFLPSDENTLNHSK